MFMKNAITLINIGINVLKFSKILDFWVLIIYTCVVGKNQGD